MVLKAVNWVHNDKIKSMVLKGINWVHNDKLGANDLERSAKISSYGLERRVK